MVAEPVPIETEQPGTGYWGTRRPVTSATAVKAEILDVSGTLVPYSSYYWTEEWQQGENEAQQEISEGKAVRFEDIDEAMAWLRSEDDEG